MGGSMRGTIDYETTGGTIGEAVAGMIGEAVDDTIGGAPRAPGGAA
jgi:hypothetical protein